jgi:regulator of replication initiation timing
MEVKDLENKVAQLEADLLAATTERDVVKKNLEAATGENQTLKTQNAEQVTELKNKAAAAKESDELIASLSQELSASKATAGSNLLSVTLSNKDRYTTPGGRRYNIDGKDVTSEALVKDKALCQKLVDIDSGILTKS